MYKTDATNPPPLNSYDFFLERGPDPFTPQTRTIQKERVLIFAIDSAHEIKEGWIGMDYAENPVSFTPDGTEFDCPVPELSLEPGHYADGRMFAYSPNDTEFRARHAQYKQDRINNEKKESNNA